MSKVEVSTFCEACSFDDERYPHTCKGPSKLHTANCKVWNGAGICTCRPLDASPKDDAVKAPSHYQLFDGTESIEVIARAMTTSEFRGFCFGNILKYRLRAGKKSDLANMEQDLKKAAFYQELFNKHKDLCYAP